jgi:hypothetical protein
MIASTFLCKTSRPKAEFLIEAYFIAFRTQTIATFCQQGEPVLQKQLLRALEWASTLRPIQRKLQTQLLIRIGRSL